MYIKGDRNSRLATFAAVISLFATLPHACAASLRVTEADAKRAAITKVAPEYPLLARQNHLTGRVELEIAIDAAGSVESASIKVGNVVLGGAALIAIKKWKFTPFAVDGKPTAAMAIISFDFHM